MQHTLLVIHGAPATGKTFLAEAISEKIQLPLISKDGIKELLYDLIDDNSQQSVEYSRTLGAASFEITYYTAGQILKAKKSCVIETAWLPKFGEPEIKKLASQYQASIMQIFVTCDETTRKKRFRERAKSNRHPVHMDHLRLNDTRYFERDVQETFLPMNLPGTTITIDTTRFDSIQIDDIVSKIYNALHDV